MDDPVVFKRKKSKPSARARETSPESAADAMGPQTTVEESPSTLATKLQTKVKRNKLKSRLSFGADEETEGGDGDVFQVKKSNLSRKVALGTHPALSSLSSSLDQASISPRTQGGPTYDKAHLSELKASTPSSRRPVAVDESYDADVSMDLNDVSMQIVDMSDVFGAETEIPSESTILNAKQKRERLKGTDPEDDFISLTVSRRGDGPQGPHPESRLMREDEELGEGDDEFAEYTSAQERIALGKKSMKAAASKRRIAMKEMIADAEEEDDETTQWEDEQLRRGGHTAADFAPKKPVKPVYRAAPIPPNSPIPTLGPTVANLAQSLANLTTSHSKNTTSAAALAEERDQLDAREAEMRRMIDAMEDKRSWFATFREWVESVATFLDEKYPQLEKLEDDRLSIIKEKADMISARRAAEDADDLSLFMGPLPQPSQGDALDEHGRTVPQQNSPAARQARITARATRRARRAHRDAEEGYSTDSSLPPPEAADYSSAMQQLDSGANEVLSDVRAQEFRDPAARGGLARWFGDWRSKYADSYSGAWGGLGLVGAWEFWVRLEIVGWSPFEDKRTLDAFAWYSSLYEYSRPRLSSAEEYDGEPDFGPDGDLVSAMITTAVIPRICKVIERGGFDPYSAQDVRKLINLVEELELSVARDHAKFQLLLRSVFFAFRDAVNASETLASPYLLLTNPPRFDPAAIPARKRFIARCTKLLQNMVRWRRYTGEVLGIGELITHCIAQLVVRAAQSGWEVGGEDCINKLRSFVPRELLPRSIHDAHGARKRRHLSICLLQNFRTVRESPIAPRDLQGDSAALAANPQHCHLKESSQINTKF